MREISGTPPSRPPPEGGERRNTTVNRETILAQEKGE